MPPTYSRRHALIGLTALAANPWLTTVHAANTGTEASIGVAEEVPYVQTPARVVQRMLQMAEVQPDELLWDLGSGDGRIVIAAARDFKARGVGFEIDTALIRESQRLAQAAGVSARTRFEERDLFTLNFAEPNIVTLYLLPEFNQKLRPLLLAQMRPGSRVVSHEWDMGDWRPDETFTLWSPEKPHGIEKIHKSMLWVIPAQVAGRWRVELQMNQASTALTAEFTLSQQYQEIQATAARGTIAWSYLRGTALALSWHNGPQRVVLRGEVGNKQWRGEIRSAGQSPKVMGSFHARMVG